VERALATSADVVIIDLEDSVGAGEKEDARAALAEMRPSRPVHVRVNSPGTRFGEADVATVAPLRWLDGVVVPMVESAGDLEQVRRQLPNGLAIVALVETAAGVLAAEEIASRADRLAFGSVDYAADLVAAPTDVLFAYPRSRLVLSSAAAGLPSPIDGPTLTLTEPARLSLDAASARALGMGAKFCIHPSQVDVVNACFSPSEAERRWALAVVESATSAGDGVIVVNGEMVDAPVVSRARQILER
jgi:citrate lyase subunit beta/citryl-CoA lyase